MIQLNNICKEMSELYRFSCILCHRVPTQQYLLASSNLVRKSIIISHVPLWKNASSFVWSQLFSGMLRQQLQPTNDPSPACNGVLYLPGWYIDLISVTNRLIITVPALIVRLFCVELTTSFAFFGCVPKSRVVRLQLRHHKLEFNLVCHPSTTAK